MSNERLQGAMAAAKLTKHALAQRLGINVKTVERWITQGRRPHPDMRLATARELGCDEAYLWPELLASRRAIAASVSEVVQFWPTRSEVPHDVWRSLMRKADRRMEVLVYAGGFLVESLDFADVVRRKAAAGVDIRVLLGASESNSQILWIGSRQATSDTGVSGEGSGVMSTGRSRSLPLWNTA
ncbi:helix-turn-helix domain-containing protein, partial [Nocardia farcinica]|uniref:helix-turn-helix domain-containing protein n=1 Tax=Nocardia farcinica TaxID=37329 RepID=UPI001893953F